MKLPDEPILALAVSRNPLQPTTPSYVAGTERDLEASGRLVAMGFTIWAKARIMDRSELPGTKKIGVAQHIHRPMPTLSGLRQAGEFERL